MTDETKVKKFDWCLTLNNWEECFEAWMKANRKSWRDLDVEQIVAYLLRYHKQEMIEHRKVCTRQCENLRDFAEEAAREMVKYKHKFAVNHLKTTLNLFRLVTVPDHYADVKARLEALDFVLELEQELKRRSLDWYHHPSNISSLHWDLKVAERDREKEFLEKLKKDSEAMEAEEGKELKGGDSD